MIKYLSTIALLLSAPLMAQEKISDLDQIFKTYNDCYDATPSTGIDADILEAAGWARGTSDNGAIEDIFLYGHAKEPRPLILLSNKSGAGICIVIAKLEKSADYSKFLAAFGDKLPKPNANGETIFKSGGRTILVSRSGSRKESTMRIAVMTPTEN